MILFVYGTLMGPHRSNSTYLSNAIYLGKGTLQGYALYDLGAYPGIVKSASDGRHTDSVKGELYDISALDISAIDRYEGEGHLYLRKTVQVSCEDGKNHTAETYVYTAETYVYNHPTRGHTKIYYEFQPWRPGIGVELTRKYVWYATYGSNLSSRRFAEYIEKCSDKTWPRLELPYIIPHPIYFANESRRWGHKGVAFLDTGNPGKSYGKIYLLTREQLAEIQFHEGPGENWYNALIKIDEKDGLDIMTITHTPRHQTENPPDPAYTAIIQKGIAETYPHLDEKAIADYLKKAQYWYDKAEEVEEYEY